jgi:hypothetical protein
MTVATDAAFDALAAGAAYLPVPLVEMQFGTGTLRLTPFPLDVVAMGQTWKGIGTLGQVGEIRESEDGAAEKITLTLSPVDTSVLALALGNPSNYQDRPVRIWLALLDPNTYQMPGAPVLRFAGVMDLVKLPRDADGKTGRIEMECVTAAYDVRANPAGLRLNNAQHQARYPGERGFEYVAGLIGAPSVWLSKRFQQQ